MATEPPWSSIECSSCPLLRWARLSRLWGHTKTHLSSVLYTITSRRGLPMTSYQGNQASVEPLETNSLEWSIWVDYIPIQILQYISLWKQNNLLTGLECQRDRKPLFSSSSCYVQSGKLSFRLLNEICITSSRVTQMENPLFHSG